VRFGRGGPPQFPPSPSERSAPSYAEESFAAALPGSSPLPWPSPWTARLGSPSMSNDAAGFASATDRSVASPNGAFDAGLDPARFQTKPPACSRASWQLPGPDSHRQATTSFRSGHDL